jgi:ATP-dependent DNA helicase RecQ
VFRQLVAAGLLATDDDGFGVLRLTAASRGVLRGETCGALAPRCRSRRAACFARKARTKVKDSNLAIAPHEMRLWQSLRDLRAQLAREQGVPPMSSFTMQHCCRCCASGRRLCRNSPQSAGSVRRSWRANGETFLGALRA